METKHIKFMRKQYCPYCGKILTETDGEYRCDCDAAMKEIDIRNQISALTDEISALKRKIESLTERLPEDKYREDDLIHQDVYEHYVLSDSQANWIKSCLGGTTYITDIIYGRPDKSRSGYIISEYDERRDVVGINLGYYQKGLGFLYYPVKDGVFVAPKLVHGNIIGIIPYNNETNTDGYDT